MDDFAMICEKCGKMTDNQLGRCAGCDAMTSGFHICVGGFPRPGKVENSLRKCMSCTKRGE